MMELALRTTVVFALAFVIAAALRRATPATRHLLWHATMIIVVAAPLILPLMPRVAVPTSFGPATISARFGTAEAVPYVTKDEPSAAWTKPLDGIGRRFSGAGPADAFPRGVETNAAPFGLSLTIVWLSGAVVTSAWFVIGWLASLWLGSRASRAPGALGMEARAVARELGLRRIPAIRLMAQARGPLTVGIFRPSILLPSVALEWDAGRRRAVFAHELAHVRRADTRTQALAHVACALYWFNPLAWMAAHALRRERERACDDVVIAMGTRPSSYAQDLLEIAQGSSTRFSPSSALAMARPTELEGRLLSVLASRRRTPMRATRWVLSAALCAIAALAFAAEPDAAATSRSRVQVATDYPPTPLAFSEDARQHDLRERQQNRDRAETLEESPDEDARERAALALALSGDASAIDALIAALGDRSSQVREKAAMGLALRSSPEVIEPLLRALRDPDAQVREKAAIGLSLRRDPRVVDALLVAIGDADSQVREKAAIALGTSGDRRAVAALRTATNDSDPQVRQKAVLGLVLLR